MVAKIYISGVIGKTDDQTQDFTTLKNVLAQFAANKNATEFEVVINSPGGSVEEGNDIFNYLKTVKNLKTIASIQCASIATKIHLAAKPENRLIEDGCLYMIHNPLFMNVSGNAQELKELAEFLKPIENDLVNLYAKSTGLDKASISGMMKQETVFTAKEAVEFGFASKVIPANVIANNNLKAVAFSEVINKHKNKMNKPETKWSVLKSALKAFFVDEEKPEGTEGTAEGNEAVNLMFKDSEGNLATTEFNDLVKGDAVFMEDGTPAPDGEYTSEDGSIVVTVVGGFVDKIEKIGEGELEIQVVALQGENETLKAELEALKKENETLKAEIKEAEEVVEVLNQSMNKTSFKPSKSPVAFRKPGNVVEVITKDGIREARAAMKNKKN